MSASKRLTLCAVVLSFALFGNVNNSTAGNSGSSHAVSAPQQKSVRQSADIKLPNKPPASRKLQKRDATVVKTPAEKQLLGDYSNATKVTLKNRGVIGMRSDTDYLKSAIGRQGKTKNTKQQDDLEKQRQEKQKELNDQREQEAKAKGLEHGNPNAHSNNDPDPLSDPIGYVEKQLKDGTTSHDPQPNRTDNFTQDANDFAKGASQYGEPTKGGSGHGFGGTAKDVMDKATKDSTPARLRNCANC
jgi:hypothetical protein